MKGFEPPTPSLPCKCSTPELHWLMRPPAANGAGDETRTRDPQLGRLMLYQLSYARLISLSVGLSVSLEISSQTHTQTHTQTPFVGVIGFEPIQTESPDLQSGPALPLRRAPMIHSLNKSRASGGTRTPDQLITNQLLYQLSYTGLISV